MKNPNTVLKLEGLTLTYEKNGVMTPVFKDFNLEIARGERVVILGESGSGKSTLAKALMGLLPTSGKIEKGSLDLAGFHFDLAQEPLDWRQIRGKEVGFIFQDAKLALNPSQKIGDQFEDLLLWHGVCQKNEVRARALDLLEGLRLKDPEKILDSYPREISGGMAQRVSIALIEALGPDIILADEPTSALDVISATRVIDDLSALKDQTLLFITHDINVATSIGTRIVVVDKGKIVEDTGPQDLISRPQAPYTKKLIGAFRGVADIQVPPLESEDKVLEVLGAEKSFGDNQVLKGLRLDLKRGQVHGILGESGCGKSTLARCIMGLEDLDGGQILLEGQDLAGLSRLKRRAISPRLQMVFQDARACLNPRLSAMSLAQEVLKYNKIGTKSDRQQRAREVLGQVGLEESLWKKRPPSLSTGQCQRVAIARAIAPRPDVLVSDEAISALDAKIAYQILQLLLELKEDLGLSIIMISHDLRVMVNTCNEVAVMQGGIIIDRRSGEEDFLSSDHPYTQALIETSGLKRIRA